MCVDVHTYAQAPASIAGCVYGGWAEEEGCGVRQNSEKMQRILLRIRLYRDLCFLIVDVLCCSSTIPCMIRNQKMFTISPPA